MDQTTAKAEGPRSSWQGNVQQKAVSSATRLRATKRIPDTFLDMMQTVTAANSLIVFRNTTGQLLPWQTRLQQLLARVPAKR